MTATLSTEFARYDAYLAELKISASFEQLEMSTDDPIARLLARQVAKAVELEQELLRLGEDIIAKVNRVKARLTGDRPCPVNGNGELQRIPADYDRLCALLNDAIQTLIATAAAYKMTRRAAA